MSAESGQSLAGKVAIVTGAGRGLGRAIALGLARAGARVTVTGARSRAHHQYLNELRDDATAGFLALRSVEGGATKTGMVPDDVPDSVAKMLLAPDIIVAPVVWLASDASGRTSGKRFNATLWRDADPAAAEEMAGWVAN